MDLRDQLRDHLSRQEGLAAAWLFGSVARGVDSPRSDVDVAVLSEGEPPLNRYGQPFELESALQKLLNRDINLFEGNRSCRVAFVVKYRNEYFDLLPHLWLYRQRAVDKVLEAS